MDKFATSSRTDPSGASTNKHKTPDSAWSRYFELLDVWLGREWLWSACIVSSPSRGRQLALWCTLLLKCPCRAWFEPGLTNVTNFHVSIVYVLLHYCIIRYLSSDERSDDSNPAGFEISVSEWFQPCVTSVATHMFALFIFLFVSLLFFLSWSG